MTIRYKNIQIETLNFLILNTIFFDYYFHKSFFIFLLAAKSILDKILDFYLLILNLCIHLPDVSLALSESLLGKEGANPVGDTSDT